MERYLYVVNANNLRPGAAVLRCGVAISLFDHCVVLMR